MSSNSGSGSTASSFPPRLGPAWRSGHQGGRGGFQPPPAVPSDKGDSGDGKRGGGSNRNPFSLLGDPDDDGPVQSQAGGKASSGGGDGGAVGAAGQSSRTRSSGYPSRSEGLRGAPTTTSSSSGGGAYSGRRTGGRSLSELASSVPPARSHLRSHGDSHRSTSSGGIGGGGGSTGYSDDNGGMPGLGGGGAAAAASNSRLAGLRGDFVDEKKVIRFTREKLLSMRPPPSTVGPPKELENLTATSLLSDKPLDPVCWDDFDADAIWAASREQRRSSIAGKAAGGSSGGLRQLSEGRRGSEGLLPVRVESGGSIGLPGAGGGGGGGGGHHGGGGTWRRGQSLPPAEEGGGKGSRRYEDAESPEDLWDDPTAPPTGAAADFSAFGGSLDDAPGRPRGGSAGSDGFDLDAMAEASLEFEKQIHGGNGEEIDDAGNKNLNVNASRPLTDKGMTIRSGSGDHVNVFEDFDAPAPQQPTQTEAIQSGDSQTASSRLMQMIGVSPDADVTDAETKSESSWVDNKVADSNGSVADIPKEKSPDEVDPANIFNAFSSLGSSSVPSNPWGEPVIQDVNTSNQESGGLDLAARMREVAIEKEKSEQMEQERLQREESEALQRRQEDEKRQAAMLAQQQAEAQARAVQQQKQQPQQQSQQNQLELILIDRICVVLEKSWGQSDLISVLQVLHNEDPRVLRLLPSVEALRALVSRHPRRIGLRKEAFGAEVAVLAMSNAQWQQQQESENLRRLQQEEQQKLAAAQKEAEEARAKAEAEAQARKAALEAVVITDDPWFYADPQGNVQGPFGGTEMRQWLEAGYFKGDLPISQNPKGNFLPLSSLFPDLEVAFKPSGPSEEEKARIAAEEQAQAEKAKLEAEMAEKANAEALAMAEKARLEKEAEIAEANVKAEIENQNKQKQSNNSATNKKQSDQLKMLLGLGANAEPAASPNVSNENGNSNNSHDSDPSPPPQKTKSVSQQKEPVEIVEPQSQTKPTKSKSSKKTAPAPTPVAEPEKVSPPQPSAPAPVPVAAWGGAGAGKLAGKKKSMSEIQMEEAKIAAKVAKQKGSAQRSGSGGWANIAASGGTGAWSGGAVSSAPVSSSIASSTSGVNGGTAYQQARSKQQSAKSTAQQNNRSNSQKTMEEFGAKMTPVLETWCREQMRKLCGNDDLTLIAFCMTLTDAMEIKQYLTAYLGSTPQVNSFAAEFINRKNGNSNQEQWESTTSKKGRKKKAGISGSAK